MIVTLQFSHCSPDMPISTDSSTFFLDIPSTWHALLLFSACWSSAQPQKTFSNADSSMGPFLITPTKSLLSAFPPPLPFVHTSLITPFLFSLIGIWYLSLSGLQNFRAGSYTLPHTYHGVTWLHWKSLRTEWFLVSQPRSLQTLSWDQSH